MALHQKKIMHTHEEARGPKEDGLGSAGVRGRRDWGFQLKVLNGLDEPSGMFFVAVVVDYGKSRIR